MELDGAPWRRLPAEVAVACSLRPGLELDRPRLRRLRAELRRVEAAAAAGRLLRHRDLAAVRLDEALAARRIAPAQRRGVVGALERSGLVDDRRLAVTRAEALAARGYGDEAIRWRLEQAGLGQELIDDAVAELESEADRVVRIVEGKGLSPRTLRLLTQRGFGEDAVSAAAAVADESGGG